MYEVTSVKEVKVCLLGESGVGKSSIVLRFVSDTFKQGLEMTIGASFMTKTLVVDQQTVKFQIWDTAGQERYRALAPMYYRGASAAIIVYDVTKRDTFDAVKGWVRELANYGPKDIIIALAGNKSDLEDLREVTKKEAAQYAEQIQAIFIETSAKNDSGIKELFTRIISRLPADFSGKPKDGHQNAKKLHEKEEKKGKCC
ncbi:ras-related protein Rab-22A [Lingula anatina]|uniref:Ras-related protein Rab-22A n=1 Tax=Lingula anatina TaxID=7574 RepID=A0A1S3HU30_LINAN|nr:ras-related protein Rab-22A [Lingula anatina]|eukprot:XP_013389046.1 ras-related protein Rab-22A [Lingula anatina]